MIAAFGVAILLYGGVARLLLMLGRRLPATDRGFSPGGWPSPTCVAIGAARWCRPSRSVSA
ncbi:MAG: hypothetical protein IPF74_16100 [Rhodocyclaceae bacterium]|nr:hypothetical protein [Rhodocyclaceae bacterium]